MTKQRRLVACLLAALIVLSVCSSYAFAAGAESERDYLALGDSISTGYGLSSPSVQGYTYIVASQGGYTLENRAVNGYTAEDIYRQIKDGALDAEIEGAELITLTCGGNDMMALLYAAIADAYNAEKDPDIEPEEVLSAFAGTHETLTIASLLQYASTVLVDFAQTDAFRAGIERYEEDLTRVMQYLRAKNETATIVLNTQYNPYNAFKENRIYGALYTEVEAGVVALNEVITDNADALGYTVADVYTAFRGSSENLCVANADSLFAPNLDFHPNAAGHAVIADTVLEIVRDDPEEETTETEADVATDETSGSESLTDSGAGESTSEEPTETTETEDSYTTDETTEGDETPTDSTEETGETDPSETTVTALDTDDCEVTEPSSDTDEEGTDGSDPETNADTASPDAPATEDEGCGSVLRLPVGIFVTVTVALASVLFFRRETETR
ncbi:MAG: hypothetical protein IKC26_03310 [Clostridia bacterium]|nr:hypothetical protein [Clostridia bacterium]